MATPGLDETKILIVDDNPHNVYSLRTLLEENVVNLTVLEAQSGMAALGMLLADTVDLILLDVQMPEMDGFETARLIRARKHSAHIPIVFLTAAYKSEEFQEQGFSVGAADYLTKPIDAPHLLARIRTYLRFVEQEKLHNHELEKRTRELAKANDRLQGEIQERKQIQAKLQQVSRQTQLVLETAGEGIFGLDTQGVLIFINPAAAEMMGYTPEELIGCKQHQIIHYAKADGTPFLLEDCKIHTAMHDGKIYRITDEVFWRNDGRPFPVEYIVSPIMEDDRIQGCVVTFKDITQRKQTEEILRRAKEDAEQANLAKSSFLANMSHELRTPLNAIIGYTDMLVEDARDSGLDGFVSDLYKVRTAGAHLLGLINDVLDLSKIEAGKMDVELHKIELASLIGDIQNTALPLMNKYENTLISNIPKILGEMNTDSTKLRQILLNLLSNAAKFTKNGQITLTVTLSNSSDNHGAQWVSFAVQDTGIGMTLEQQDKVFDAFTQADSTTTRKYGGTGLGLAISKKFAEMLGGTIVLTSEFGVGSCFTLHLPADSSSAEAALIAGLHQESAEERTSGKGTVVVVVMADEELGKAIQAKLNRRGYSAALAVTGREGLDLITKLQPDVLMMPPELPDMTVERFALELHANPFFTELPIILVGDADTQKALVKNVVIAKWLPETSNSEQLLQTVGQYRVDYHKSPLVMVVDDTNELRRTMGFALKKQGWRVIQCGSGNQALRQLDERRPHLIVLDLMMPDMDGFEFLTHVRKSETWYTIPVIVVTALELDKELLMRLKNQVTRIIYKTQDSLLVELTAVAQPVYEDWKNCKF